MIKLAKMVYPLAVIAAFLSILISFKHDATLTGEEKQEIDRHLAGAAPQAAEEISTVDATAPSVEVKEAAESRSTFSFTNRGEAEVSLKAEEAMWFELYDVAEDEKISEGRWQAGEEQTWDISEYEEVYFHFDNARAAELAVNGEPLPLSKAAPAHYAYIDIETNE
ncbi:RodZ domain-containing protein [Alkalicoccus halolimnae]|uniref:RodZ domain-containing protein n=1 Tax=Alkalicoccus halolimnae TaxID=1667239 RepID=A0A5C7F673_9BACI|nr:RodZ domain-containing protein [Alkalicoccus halolimnae]TXF85513.1 DUF4115 domain-containing protein [Alkalicoccus halolimnae]